MQHIDVRSRALERLLVDFDNHRVCVQFRRQRGVYLYSDVPEETINALRTILHQQTHPTPPPDFAPAHKRRRLTSVGAWVQGITALPFRHFASLQAFQNTHENTQAHTHAHTHTTPPWHSPTQTAPRAA